MSVEAWIRKNAGDAPERLIEAMLEAVRECEGDAIPDRLAEGALLLYERVVAGDGGREVALPLLAADALFTHAFQAMAETDPGGLEYFADRWASSERLAGLAS